MKLRITNYGLQVVAVSIISFLSFGQLVFGQGIFTDNLNDSPGAATTASKVIRLFDGLACYFIRFGIIALGIMMIVYGILFFKGRGSASGMADAKKALTWGIVGGLVIMGVFTIILTVSSLVGYNATGYTGYDILNIVKCF